MYRYTNILTGNSISTKSEMKGRNWIKSDEIDDFKKQAKELETKAVKKEVEEEKEELKEIEVELPADLKSLTKSDLSELLFSLGVNHDSKMTKDELIELIEENR